MKNKCAGCIALVQEISTTGDFYICDLGHSIGYKIIKTNLGSSKEYYPLEDCQKPLTIKKYVRLKTKLKYITEITEIVKNY